MRRRYRALLTLGLIALSGAALAQGLGFGTGSDDLYPGKGAGVAPPSHILLLVGGGGILLVGGGGIACVGSC